MLTPSPTLPWSQPSSGLLQAEFLFGWRRRAPAEFSYGPTDADVDARFLARGNHGVQFPQSALDQWMSVLPGLPWVTVHGEVWASVGASAGCRLVAIVAWSQKATPIRASILEKTWKLEFIAVVLTALMVHGYSPLV